MANVDVHSARGSPKRRSTLAVDGICCLHRSNRRTPGCVLRISESRKEARAVWDRCGPGIPLPAAAVGREFLRGTTGTRSTATGKGSFQAFHSLSGISVQRRGVKVIPDHTQTGIRLQLGSVSIEEDLVMLVK